MITDTAHVDALLDELAALTAGEDRAMVSALRERVRTDRFRVLVVGEAKRGKSSLVNALLGRELLPTGVVPVTALPTVVRRGPVEELHVRYLDGHGAVRPLTQLADLVTEARNPDNRLGVAEVVVTTPARQLPDGVDLVDTPGVGSVFAHSSAAATAALDTMDAGLFVLSADPPISGSERAFLSSVRDRSVALFCALNKIDNLAAGEVVDVVAFTTDVLSRALGRPGQVYPVSARRALDAERRGDAAGLAASGVPALLAELTGYLWRERGPALAASVAGHAARLAARQLDRAVLTRRAVQLTAAQAGEQITRFAEQLATLDEFRHDGTDVVRASTARLLADLDDAARWDTPRLTAEVRGRVVAALEASPAGSAGQVEDLVRAEAVAAIRAVVDGWRAEREAVIADGLAAVDARLTGAVQRQVRGVRQAAHDLLQVDLAIPVPAGRLLPEVGVSYAFGEEVGVATQWEGLVRRHLPGRWGRRAVRAHLLDEVDWLVGKQLGRVRAALREALRPATAAMVKAVEQRYTDATAGLLAALNAAQALADAPDTAAQLRDLDARVAATERLIGSLTAIRDTAGTAPAARPEPGAPESEGPEPVRPAGTRV